MSGVVIARAGRVTQMSGPPAVEPGDDAAIDVVAVGSAIVDILVHATPADLARLEVDPGTMTLVDLVASERLRASVAPVAQVSGGSVANTAVGVAALGGTAGFIGRTADDELGSLFCSDLARSGVQVGRTAHTPGAGGAAGAAGDAAGAGGGSDAATGRCVVLVTPDGERTMVTHLGVASMLTTHDLDQDMLAAARVVYLEGYLWDVPSATAALHRAIEVAHAGDGLVAVSVSDRLCVERHRRELLDLLRDDVDVLFANEEEAIALMGVPTVDAAVAAIEETGVLSAVTLGPAGSVVVMPGSSVTVPAVPVGTVVDTTGAGDLYAAGFLYGLTNGANPVECARLGGACAAEIISHMGARPQADLRGMLVPGTDARS